MMRNDLTINFCQFSDEKWSHNQFLPVFRWEMISQSIFASFQMRNDLIINFCQFLDEKWSQNQFLPVFRWEMISQSIFASFQMRNDLTINFCQFYDEKWSHNQFLPVFRCKHQFHILNYVVSTVTHTYFDSLRLQQNWAWQKVIKKNLFFFLSSLTFLHLVNCHIGVNLSSYSNASVFLSLCDEL